MKINEPQILLTNDDGILSPGLWAAAEALATLGFVSVAAPREQSSGAGRSLPSTSSGSLRPEEVKVNGKTWTAYAVGGSPAQAVLHGIYEITPRKPDVVVSGINYGLNVGYGITVSGTVGAALEAASSGIPALAISLETDSKYHLSYSTEIDFSTAAYFTAYFAQLLLERDLPDDVHVLKVEIPATATPNTPWRMTRISSVKYYTPVPPQRQSHNDEGKMGYRVADDWDTAPEASDIHAVHIQKVVSVTPLSLDLTSRVNLEDLEYALKAN
ncbi:MAG: 5'/3'-nucleotidase SurE [Chloroflexota bacterium]|nr:5'/3'-nucleotidase SurE [Chloroflexota bacterium]